MNSLLTLLHSLSYYYSLLHNLCHYYYIYFLCYYSTYFPYRKVVKV